MAATTTTPRPLVGITTDLAEHPNGVRVFTYRPYAEAIERAGAVPVLLPPAVKSVEAYVDRLDAFLLTGGDDPCTEPFGVPTHPSAVRIHPDRQAFETALLERLARSKPDTPVLGICLGMQLMALVAGGRLDQHLPETCPTHAMHWEQEHAVEPAGDGAFALRGVVRSKHRQAVADPAGMLVIARAPDGLIEALCDPARRFFLGVQWHPERTADPVVGRAVFEALVAACRA